MGWGNVRGASAWFVLCALGCDPAATAEPRRDHGEEAAPGPVERGNDESERGPSVDAEGLLIGEFRLSPNAVVDGDGIRVAGIDGSIRLLGIDTEEIFHGKERAAAERDFEAYLTRKRGNSVRPVKTGTPLGEEAKEFAEAFFEGAETVRLERDDPKTTRGGYGRLLAYAFVEKDGRWSSYNIECVRAGMSPYFTKYGYSQRFHNQFSRAEAEAREAQRGIWDPKARGYGDYDERKAWWNARADFIRMFEQEANARDDFIDLSHRDAVARLERHLGKQVSVLSTVAEIKRFKRLTRVGLSMSGKRLFPLIFFDRTVFEESGIGEYAGEPIVARGVVERYVKGDYETLQIVVDRPDQIALPKLPPTN